MNIAQLKIFVDAVAQGNFAAVARRLNVSPSLISRAIRSLEDELGTRLFHRTTRKLALTNAGISFHQRTQSALQEIEFAANDARESGGKIQGNVRLTASVAFGQKMLLPLLPALHEKFPGLIVDAVFTDAVVDLLSENIDIALRLGRPADSSLIGMELAPVRYRVCASPGYLVRCGQPQVPSDLSLCDCLRLPLPGFDALWRFRSPAGQVESIQVRGWLLLSTALALLHAAVEGIGPALLPDWLIKTELAQGQLVDLFPHHEVSAANFDSSIWLLYVSRAQLPRRVRSVVDFLKQRLCAA